MVNESEWWIEMEFIGICSKGINSRKRIILRKGKLLNDEKLFSNEIHAMLLMISGFFEPLVVFVGLKKKKTLSRFLSPCR